MAAAAGLRRRHFLCVVARIWTEMATDVASPFLRTNNGLIRPLRVQGLQQAFCRLSKKTFKSHAFKSLLTAGIYTDFERKGLQKAC